jgi:hypothetical protein
MNPNCCFCGGTGTVASKPVMDALVPATKKFFKRAKQKRRKALRLRGGSRLKGGELFNP